MAATVHTQPNPLHTNLTNLCSVVDKGGGVLSISNATPTFIVYTTATLPPLLGALIANPPDGLPGLASAVVERIPIHLTHSTLDGVLSAPPCPVNNGSREEVDRLPWFFLNAAGCSKHAIAGRGSVLETLLCVLLRPWCVLELCCAATTEGLGALLQLARYAVGLGFVGYHAATMLLAHELGSRSREEEGSFRQVWDFGRLLRKADGGTSVGPRRTHHYTSLVDLAEMCTAVFGTSIKSYNGFWLRLISLVGLGLGEGFSTLGLLLRGDKDVSLTIGGASHLLSRTMYPVCEEPETGRKLLRSVSLTDFSNRRRGLDRRKNGNVESKEFFVCLYRHILKKLGEVDFYTLTK